MDLQSQGHLTFLIGYEPSTQQASCKETATFMTINLDISTPENNLAPVTYKMHRLSWLVYSLLYLFIAKILPTLCILC